MPGERGVLSLLLAVVITGTAIDLPQTSSAPPVPPAASARAAGAQQLPSVPSGTASAQRDDVEAEVVTPTPEQLRQIGRTQ